MRSILNLIQDLSLYTFDIENYDTDKYIYIVQTYNKKYDNYSYTNLGTYISHTDFAVKFEDAFGKITTYMFNDLKRMTILRYKKIETKYAKVYENDNNQYQVTFDIIHNNCMFKMFDICHIQNKDTRVQYFQYNNTLVAMYSDDNTTVYTFRPIIHDERDILIAKNLRVELPFIMNHNDKIKVATNFCEHMYNKNNVHDTVLLQIRNIVSKMDKSDIYNLQQSNTKKVNLINELNNKLANYMPKELLKEYGYGEILDSKDNTDNIKYKLTAAIQVNNERECPGYGYDDNDLVIEIAGLQICVPMSKEEAENIMNEFDNINDDKLFTHVYNYIMNELNISEAICLR